MARLNDEMSAYELRDWQILEQIEPWGERGADYRAAKMAWAIASSMSRGGYKNRLLRFFLRLFSFERDNSESSIEQLFAFAGQPEKKKGK